MKETHFTRILHAMSKCPINRTTVQSLPFFCFFIFLDHIPSIQFWTMCTDSFMLKWQERWIEGLKHLEFFCISHLYQTGPFVCFCTCTFSFVKVSSVLASLSSRLVAPLYISGIKNLNILKFQHNCKMAKIFLTAKEAL